MKVDKSTEFKVGLVSIVAILILIAGIVLVKGVAVSNSTEIKIRMPHSGGIKPSSPVVVNGVKRGAVSQIIPDNNSVLIIANIDNIDDLTSDVTAKITILEITGGKKLELINGISNEKFIATNEIRGVASKDIGDLVALVGDASNDLINIIRKIDTISTSINNILQDTTMIGNIKNTFENTKDLTQNLNSFINENKSELNQTIDNLNILTKDLKVALQKNEPKIGKLLDSIDVTINKANKLITNFDNVSVDADKLIKDVNSVVNDIKTNESILNRIAYDKNFAMKVDTAVMSISKLVDFINQNGVNVNVRLGTRP